ncbi:hypothetical protein R6Z07M_016424 [Ovis aries]
MAAAAELTLLEKSQGLSKGNKHSAQGERQIPVLQTNNGPSLTGLTTVAAHLVKQASKECLLGSPAEEKAVVQRWLEYRKLVHPRIIRTEGTNRSTPTQQTTQFRPPGAPPPSLLQSTSTEASAGLGGGPGGGRYGENTVPIRPRGARGRATPNNGEAGVPGL